MTTTIKAAGADRLWTKSYVALLITQFLVSLNDNLFRWLIVPIGKCAVGWSDSPDMVRMIGALAFLVPFLIFTAYAGYCCDRFNRRSVIIWCKAIEIVIMVIGTVAILQQHVPGMLIILFIMGAVSAFFSPVKYSALPSVVPENRISEANGYYSMTTMIACISGQLLGGILFVWTTLNPESPIDGTGGMNHWWLWSGTIIGISVIGLISSLFIPSLKAADPKATFPLNPFGQTWADLRFLFRHRYLFWVGLGSAFFWGLGALSQTNIDKYATEILHVRQDFAMLLLVGLTFGLAFGSLIAGWVSRGKANMGLIPIGVMLIIVFSLVLWLTPEAELTAGSHTASWRTFSFFFGAFGLFLLGCSAGIFDIPLLTTMQTESPEGNRGRIMAAYNFFSFSAMALFSLLQGVLASPKGIGLSVPGMSANGIWFVVALLAMPVFFIALKAFFIPFLSLMVRMYFWFVYGPRIIDIKEIPENGPVLLVGNHVSYLDALLLYSYSPRPIRFIAHRDYIPGGFASYVAKKTGVITFNPEDKRSVVTMLREARAALDQGEVVCIFPEGGITRTGQVNPFKPGFLALIKGREKTPIVPFYIGGLWGSRFAYARPTQPRHVFSQRIQRMTLAFGPAFFQPKCEQHVQHIVEELGVEAMDPTRFPKDRHFMIPARQMLRNCHRFARLRRLADSTGTELTGRDVLVRALVFRRFLHRILGNKNQIVGLLFPTSVGGVMVNAAIGLDRRIPVNLNFTLSNETMNICLKRIGITHIITTKKLLQKLPNLALDAELIVLEDMIKSLKKSDKLIGFIQSLLPVWILERILGLTNIQLNEINTIVLTSGSTGLPKGAILTHSNVLSNMQGFYQVFRPTTKDIILATLPLFHSYGYSTMSWFPLIQEMGGLYHYSPLDPKVIGELSRKYRPSIFPSTPTFFRNYIRRCPPECFDMVGCVVGGAEKLPAELAQAWHDKFGQQLVEGFGVTELAPVLAANVPDCRRPDTFFPYCRDGSIGRIIPGFVARIVDLDTGVELMPNEQGMLEVKGHSVTPGYYNDPERTLTAFHDGWYVTGDIAKMDEDGFIFITGRQTRMSKIGGEMVPHVLIEERITEVIKSASGNRPEPKSVKDDAPDTMETLQAVVTAVPDDKKGEKIVVLYTELPLSPEDICKRLLESGLPPIWVPAPTNFRSIEKIPMLGTGKLSLKEIKDIALALYQ